MAFNAKNLSVIAYANGFTLWHYRSPDDALAAITGAGYFNSAADLLRVADIVAISDSAGSAGIRQVSSNSGGTVAVAALA